MIKFLVQFVIPLLISMMSKHWILSPMNGLLHPLLFVWTVISTHSCQPMEPSTSNRPIPLKHSTPQKQCFCDNSPSKAVLAYISKPADEFNKRDEKILYHTAKKKLKSSEDTSVLRVKTGGQPIYFARVSKSRKSSLAASSHLLTTRARQIERARKLVVMLFLLKDSSVQKSSQCPGFAGESF